VEGTRLLRQLDVKLKTLLRQLKKQTKLCVALARAYAFMQEAIVVAIDQRA
jgi:hypothetical protein